MARIATTTLTGASGERYEFNVYAKRQRFNDFIAGVYSISRRREQGDGKPEETVLFIGNSDDIDGALRNHPKKTCFEEHGYDSVSIHRMGDPDVAARIEQDLVSALKPTCND